ncbi:MAG: coproporphyrinogen III oxidase [Betaproteobacteria bacterium ADurb.Bin341]|nr:MAG: coproporphyrinogen III oxidase [Betaproteobacteria bacterium ADurb.Bin341]
MQLDHYVHTLGSHLKNRFGERVHKLPLHAGFTCPNRDGTIGRGGCSFCSVDSFSEERSGSVDGQLAHGRQAIAWVRRYLAYFQAYTNTYAEIEHLRALYDAALASRDVVGLCVGTRPDCVPDAVLDLLAAYQEQGAEIWLELGLQSAFDETLDRIHRGHGFKAYAETVARAQARSIPVCAHLIVGLPGERAEDSLVSLERVLNEGVQGLKLHPLMIVRGSQLAAEHQRGEVALLSLEQYVETAAEMIRRTPAEVIFHRVGASARAPTLIAPDWCTKTLPTNNAIAHHLARLGAQGCRTPRPYKISASPCPTPAQNSAPEPDCSGD